MKEELLRRIQNASEEFRALGLLYSDEGEHASAGAALVCAQWLQNFQASDRRETAPLPFGKSKSDAAPKKRGRKPKAPRMAETEFQGRMAVAEADDANPWPRPGENGAAHDAGRGDE